MPRVLDSKITYRCTKQQHAWLNAFVAEHNTTTQNLITAYLTELGMPDKSVQVIPPEQMTLFDIEDIEDFERE